MATFKDAMGREWNVALDGPKIRAVRQQCEGLDPITGEAYERLHGDPLLLADVLAVLCAEQIAAKQIPADNFRAEIKGDAIDAATKAFLDAQLDFSPSSQREVLRAVAARMAKVRETAMSKAMDWLASPELDHEIEAAIDRAKAQALTQLSSATSLPAS